MTMASMNPPAKAPLQPSLSSRRRRSEPLVTTPDRCKCCTRVFSKLLQNKSCYYCKQEMCALCVFKIPMFHNQRKALAHSPLHAKLCANCYDDRFSEFIEARDSHNEIDYDHDGDIATILSDDSRLSSSSSGESHWTPTCGQYFRQDLRLSQTQSKKNLIPHKPIEVHKKNTSDAASIQHHPHYVQLWLSLFAAVLLLIISLAEELVASARMGLIVAIFFIFITFHPLIHICNGKSTSKLTTSKEKNKLDSTSTNVRTTPTSLKSAALKGVLSKSNSNIEVKDLALVCEEKRSYLKNRLLELQQPNVQWTEVKKNNAGTIIVYELDCGEEVQPIVKAEGFIPNVKALDFLTFLNSDDAKNRGKWDSNLASHTQIEVINNARIIHNVQKSFMAGFISSRDFCLTSFHEQNTNILFQCSIVHPLVPEKQGVTRGTMHFICFTCEPSVQNDTEGFKLTYYNHVDIGGSIPRKLVANGTVDKMLKMMQDFTEAKKKLGL